jgi:hypothetical protein
MDCTCSLFAYESSCFLGFLFTPIKACYETATVSGGEHSLGDHYENALATIAMAAAVPAPIAKAPFHNTHGTSLFFFFFLVFFGILPFLLNPLDPSSMVAKIIAVSPPLVSLPFIHLSSHVVNLFLNKEKGRMCVVVKECHGY